MALFKFSTVVFISSAKEVRAAGVSTVTMVVGGELRSQLVPPHNRASICQGELLIAVLVETTRKKRGVNQEDRHDNGYQFCTLVLDGFL